MVLGGIGEGSSARLYIDGKGSPRSWEGSSKDVSVGLEGSSRR